MNKALLRDIARRFFIGNPVKLGQRIEGQSLSVGGSYLLGCYAGPEQSKEHLFHEMCHLAEREPNKLLEFPSFGWGFSQGEFWEVAGQCGWEPQTEQSVLREARVWSYQLSLMREYSLPTTASELVSSAVYLPAFCHFKYNRVNKARRKTYDDSEREALHILAALVERQSAQYSFAEFERNWNERMEILRRKALTF